MKPILCTLAVLALMLPVASSAQMTVEVATGAAFRGANGDDTTDPVSWLALGYDIGRWSVGGGYIYGGMLDMDTIERVFLQGKYRIKMEWPFYIEAKLGYTNDAAQPLGDFMFQPGLSIEVALSDEISAFTLGELTASSNTFTDAVTAQNAVRDAQIGAGVRFTPSP